MDAGYFESVGDLVETLRPRDPVFCIRPHLIRASALRFRAAFPGTVLYAVKCNPHPGVLAALHSAGIRDFDVASLPEIASVDQVAPGSSAYFMHPVKDREAITLAHSQFGVRSFVVDCAPELEKVLEETGGKDVCIFVRVATPPLGDALYHLASKFGAEPAEAADLVREARRSGCTVGLTFHVGSQCLEPKAYRVAFELLGDVIESSGVEPFAIDVGGGFPRAYPGQPVPALEEYVEQIAVGLSELGLSSRPELMAEPGRALVADGCSVVTQVKLRKGERLYLNDGVYGSFSELIDSEQELPARLVRSAVAESPAIAPFFINGPTCDSLDMFASPLQLEDDVAEGDWVEIGQAGAYSNALSTGFNGFGARHFAEVADEPVPFPEAPLESELAADSS